MASRINIARPAGSGFTPEHHGMSNGRPMSTGYRATDPEDPLEKIRELGKQIEDNIELYAEPLRPHLPAIGRFLIIVTFIEDSFRILSQWGDQLWYLQNFRGFPWGISHLFLLGNVIVMLVGSGAVITKEHIEHAIGGLLGVILVQGMGYGVLFDLTFFLRNLSVIGGLFMVFSDTLVTRRTPFAGLPNISEDDRRKYFLLAGRVLLIFLFLGFLVQGEWSFGRVFLSIAGLGASGMVAVGFKAKWSAAFLVLILSVFNVFANNWWSVHSEHPQRDFLKYDFFQTLSIVGGLILLVNIGPGGLSVDEKKKTY